MAGSNNLSVLLSWKINTAKPPKKGGNGIVWRRKGTQSQWKLDCDSERGTFLSPSPKRVLLMKTLHRRMYVLG